MKTSSGGTGAQQGNASVAAAEVEKKSINAELWQTCAGPLVNIPAAGTYVVYFPQGHSEQVAASLKKEGDAQIPNYPNLPSKLLCILRNVTLHADPETDEVHAQMTLQPVPLFDKEAVLRSELSMKVNKPHTEFFCKTLTASDTSTHGGFSVPRRAAEKIFPPLDFTMQPPAQEIVARDLHDYVWTFRHIYRGQPKRHLLTTGWSLFVSGKRLLAGDSVLFIRDEKQQLLLGIRRATRQSTNLSLSMLSTDSMHIGILAAAAHAAANNSPFTIFYNPRTSPSEFVIPLAKYYKAVYNYQISPGMRFRMLFETEESGTRRYMGTITGVNDLDPIRWKGSQWRNIQVGWDESAGEKRNRVSIWEIEPVTAPFFICPAPSLLSSKHPRPPGMLVDDSSDFNSLFMRSMPWLGDDFGLKDAQAMPGLSLTQWMNMKQNPSLANSVLPTYMNSLASSALPNLQGANITHNLGLSETQLPQQNNLPFSPQMPTTQAIQQLDQLQKLSSSPLNPSGSSLQSLKQLTDVTQPPRQRLLSQTMPTSQVQSEILQSHSHSQAQNVLPLQHFLPNHQLHSNLSPIMSQQQQLPVLSHPQQHNPMSSQMPDHVNQQRYGPQNQLPHQLLQNLHPNQQFLLAQQSAVPQPSQMNHLQDHPKQLFDIPPNFPRSVSASQMLDVAQAMPSQSNQKCAVTSESSGNAGNPSRPIYNQLSAGSSSLLPGPAPCGVQPAVSDDAPSCSTSPSTNNCPNAAQSITNGRHQQTGMMRKDEIAWFSATLSKNPCVMETLPSSSNLVNDILVEANAKPSLNIPKSQNQNFLGPQPQAYVNAPGAQTDGLDSSSSVTSVLSQNDAQVPPGNISMPFNSQPMFFRDARENWNVQDDRRSNAPFESSIENQFGMPTTPQHLSTRRMGLGKDFPTDESCGGGMVSSYQNAQQDFQPEPSSSMVSQSFGVPDMTFNSIDSTINNGSFMNTGAWAPPQIPRMRTFTKVYKRGAVGRSIDITRYSGYDDLKQDLARRFGIEGQLEDRQRIGWKLVYVDHENDVLLVGDDPWEEFVNCVRCIKILSPQEVEQMSLAGDFGSSVPLNQACGSSEITE